MFPRNHCECNVDFCDCLTGCDVLIAARNVDRLHESAKEIRQTFAGRPNAPRVEVIQCNIRKEDQVNKTCTNATKLHFFLFQCYG